jgi:hypothetical protein
MSNKMFFLAALLFSLSASLALAQSSGTIRGVVSDNTGAVIPGASILVKNLDTGVESKAATNQVGLYTVPALNPGRYSVTCASQGFAPKVFPNLRLEVSQTSRVDCKLALGNVVETIEVTAAAQLLQSEKTEVGQVIDGKRIVEMPLNGRNYIQLARFTAGVLPSRQFGKGTRQDGEQGGEGGFLAVGMHAALGRFGRRVQDRHQQYFGRIRLPYGRQGDCVDA